MASNYRILSAFSDSGANLCIPIEWDFDKVSDLSVIIVDDTGNAKRIDYWKWNSALKQVEINNTQGYKYWAVYVMRDEDSATVLQAVASMEVNAQNIIEQFKKTNRIIEQIQETSKTTLRSPDYIEGILPNATKRAKRFLSFDEEGNPVCEVGVNEFDDALNIVNTEKERVVREAKEEIDSHKASVLDDVLSYTTQASNYASGASVSASEASQSASSASVSANSASVSASSALDSANEASASANEASNYASGASVSAQTAQQFAEIAQSADVGLLMIRKQNAGVLHCNGGYAIANNVDYPEVFSVAFRTDWDFSDTSKKFTPLKLGMSGSYGLNLYSLSSDGRLRLYVYTSSVSNVVIASYKYTDIRSQLGTGLNSFVLIIAKDTDGNFLPKLYVNNNPIENLSTTKTQAFTMGSGEFKLNCYTANNITAGDIVYQDVCVFGFDISAENAPYTLADYQTGKSIPPSLKNVVYFGSGKNPNVVSSDALRSWSGNNYTITQTSITATTKALRYEFPLNKGESINVKFTGLTGGVMVNGAYGKFDFLNSALSSVKTLTIASEILNESWVATDNVAQVRFTFNCDAVDSADARVPTVLENFKIVKNGITLSLEDYTIGGKILDYSGNKNHATITGSVAGDYDTNVEAFVETITTLTSEQN